MFKLTIEDDEGKTTVIPLIRDEMTIGRQEGNTIRLTERNVSRKHARLVRQNGALFIEDMSSFIGVRVNGAKITERTPVREGDEVQIGDYKLMLRSERPPVAVDGDRATSPNMPAAIGPIATVGGSFAIPTRATPAMAAAVPAGGTTKSYSSPSIPAIPSLAAATATAPMPTTVPPPLPPVVAIAAGTPEMMDAQPTIPVRTLDTPAPAVKGEAAPPARLMVLTTELGGMEFALSRASLVIGRTDENEIVLNHRSISRHHAKIVHDGDRYTIVDLQSANGVRVNGEDYERIELNPGDIVELGHVKLRFIGPYEHYVYDPKAHHDRMRSPIKIAGLALGGVAVVAGLAFVYQRASRSSDGAGGVAQSSAARVPASAPSSAGAAVAAAPAVPAAAATPPAPAAAVTPQALLAEAARAAGGEDWEAARAALDRIGTQPADANARRQAGELRKRIDLERQGAVAFARFDEAQTAKDYAVAVARYQEIPGDSIYKKRGYARFAETRALLVHEHLEAAGQARATGNCAQAMTEAEAVTRLEPQNQLAKDLVRLCRSRAEPIAAAPRSARPKSSSALAAQSSRTERVDRSPEAAAPKRSEPAAAAAAEPEVDVDVLMKQAREAWLKQQCGSALDYSRKALRARPGMTDAYQIIAVCSCSLKDADGATRAYAKLDDKSRNLVHSLCQKNGITVGAE